MCVGSEGRDARIASAKPGDPPAHLGRKGITGRVKGAVSPLKLSRSQKTGLNQRLLGTQLVLLPTPPPPKKKTQEESRCLSHLFRCDNFQQNRKCWSCWESTTCQEILALFKGTERTEEGKQVFSYPCSFLIWSSKFKENTQGQN